MGWVNYRLHNYEDVNENSQENESWRYWLFDRSRTVWFFLSYFSAAIAVGIEGRPKVLWKLILAFVGAEGNNLFSIFTIFQSAWRTDKIRRKNDIHDRECTSWARLHVVFVNSLFLMQIGVIFLEDSKVKNVVDAYALAAIGVSHQLFAGTNRQRAKGRTCSDVRLQQRLRNRHRFFTPQQERYQYSAREIYDSQRVAYGYLEIALRLLQTSKNAIIQLKTEAPEEFLELCGSRLNNILKEIDGELANLQQISSNIHNAITETRDQEHYSESSEDIIHMVDSQANTNSGDSGNSDSATNSISTITATGNNASDTSNTSSVTATEYSINSETQPYVRIPSLLLTALNSIDGIHPKIQDAISTQISKADIERLEQSSVVLNDVDDAIAALRTDAKIWTVGRMRQYNGISISMS
ncbi:MAG: hypothetical protein KAS93_01070, partial [Gammaproteobacteria bacterium]|nr:hypothetical protein [Gammaproteobacteria bacterium]